MNPGHSFASDNWAGAHPRILEALSQCNEGHIAAYGEDRYTREAIKKIQEIFESDAEVIFTYNGTAANVLSLALCCQPYEAVICAETAHINNDECGALEKVVGCKIYSIPTLDGKLTPMQIEPFLEIKGNVHRNQPRVVSISQPTEYGTVYSVREIKKLAQWAHRHNLLLHIDGARIANAAVHLAESVAQFTTYAGADVVTFGGTKNGMLFGEAIVVLNHRLTGKIKYLQKQNMQLLSKMRFIGAQYIAYLNNFIWIANASHANMMARLLETEIKGTPQVNIIHKVQTNCIFARIPADIVAPLQAFSYFYRWEEGPARDNSMPMVRWMCSFNTQKEDVLAFADMIKKLINK
jgi:threonine aldolase